MITSGQTIEKLFGEVLQLAPDERLRFVQSIIESLLTSPLRSVFQPLRYGEFAGTSMSTEQDFVSAAWHPTEQQLDGG